MFSVVGCCWWFGDGRIKRLCVFVGTHNSVVKTPGVVVVTQRRCIVPDVGKKKSVIPR